MANHSSILAWKIPWTRRLAGCIVHGIAELDTTEHTHTLSWKSTGGLAGKIGHCA